MPLFDLFTNLDLPAAWLACTIIAFLFGACIGSFLNVCIYRIPLDQSVVWPSSHCMSCGHRLAWWQNLPVVSYFLLRGKCHYCKTSFSARYALVELLTALLFVLPFLAFPHHQVLVDPSGNVSMTMPQAPILGIVRLTTPALIPVLWVFLSGLVIATFVDFDHYIIPDSVSVGGMPVGLLLSALVPAMHGQTHWVQGLLHSGLGLVVGFGLLLLIAWLGEKAFHKEAMGMGDIKLMGMIGAFWGWKAVLFTLVAGSFVGAFVGILSLVTGKRSLGSRLPFGPYLALGAFLWLFWGPKWMALYLAFLAPPP